MASKPINTEPLKLEFWNNDHRTLVEVIDYLEEDVVDMILLIPFIFF